MNIRLPPYLPARKFPAASGLDRIALLVHHCGSVPVHHTHLSLPQKRQSSESSDGNLRLSTSCSAPFSRACGRYATAVYSGRGADIVMQSSSRGDSHCPTSEEARPEASAHAYCTSANV